MSEMIGVLSATDSLGATLTPELTLTSTLGIAGEPVYIGSVEIDDYTIKRNSSGQIYVNVVNSLTDQTLPITAAAVNVTVGNINSILTTI